MKRKHLKYGGVSFVNNVSPEEINRFVQDLPSEDKDSLFEVVNKLKEAGLILYSMATIPPSIMIKNRIWFRMVEMASK